MSAMTLPSIPEVLRNAGPRPWLLGYDVNAIQELITAPSRPIAMLGVSATIRLFDEAVEHRHAVFSGGGRGLLLVPSPEEAEARGYQLVRDFRQNTYGGVLAAAWAPYDPGNPRGSLRWLHSKLELAKDAAEAPGHEQLVLPRHKSEECADCNLYTATHNVSRKDGPDERVCLRCRAMVDAGRGQHRDLAERIQSLVDLDSARKRWIAAISIDGNNLGEFFRGLETLEALREGSETIAKLFQDAGHVARNGLNRDIISLATGGDDLRLFMAAAFVLPYLETFVQHLESSANAQAKRFPLLARLGVGIGAVIADPRLPARQLMHHAHELERSAKHICRDDHVRSALDFTVLTAGTASIHDPSTRANDLRPVAMTGLPTLLDAARRVRELPTSQLALLDGAAADSEFTNLLCYQVARSPEWQRWYTAAGHDWRNPKIVLDERPRPVHLDLARLQTIAGDGHAI